MLNKEYYKKLRSKYLPEKIVVIFVLESPPASGKYFYNEDGKMNEILFMTMMKLINYKAKDKKDGLAEFKKKGFFIVDSTYQQVDSIKDDKEKNLIIIKDLPNLIKDLQEIAGKKKNIKLIPVKKNVCEIISGPVSSMGFKVIKKTFPFPVSYQQKRFLKGVGEII